MPSSGDYKLRSAHAAKHVWVAVITNLESQKKKIRYADGSSATLFKIIKFGLEIKQYIPGD